MRALAVAVVALVLSCGGVVLNAQAQSTAQPSQSQTTPRTTSPSAPAGQFSSESDAKLHCPTDNVVWANTQSKIYHYSGTKYYGKTKQGAYMCQQDSDRSGFHAAKNEKAPS
jgi:hypothetical protein